MTVLNLFKFTSTLGSVVLLIAPVTRAEQHGSPPAIVNRYCSGCHGTDGRSQLPYIPRLAGLNAAYAERKMATFKAAAPIPVDEAFTRFARIGNSGTVDRFTPEATTHMVGTAHALSSKDLRAATLWYASRQPAPGKNGNSQAMEKGRDLYLNGLQSRRIPACQSCHGPEAQGTSISPRLAGQNSAYMLSQLALFRSDERQKSPMTEIARSLGNDQARALAAYLQSH